MIEHDQYKLIRHDRNTDSRQRVKRGGGLCIYIKKTIDVELSVNDSINSSDECLEFLHLSVLPKNQKKVDVCLVYCPPNGSVISCITKIKDNIIRLKTHHGSDEVVLLGDLNIDISARSRNRGKITELSRTLNLTQLIGEPTTITQNTSTIIDVCFTNIRHIASSGTIASDHLPIFIIKKKINPSVEKTTFIGRSYVNLGSDEFKCDMENFPVNLILRELDPSKSWDVYYQIILGLLNKYCPERTFTTKSNRAPYVSNELIQLSKNRDKLLKKHIEQKMIMIGTKPCNQGVKLTLLYAEPVDTTY